jgi:hypothetical protein
MTGGWGDHSASSDEAEEEDDGSSHDMLAAMVKAKLATNGS